MTARNLVLVRAGDQSLHESWLERGPSSNWDFAISCYGSAPKAADKAIFVHMQAGPKWAGLAATLDAHDEVVRKYDYVWLPDDDIACTAATIDRMFDVARRYKMDLAQPALEPGSYFSHTITLYHEGFELRFTNFVELMVPVFSREFLQRAKRSMVEVMSGWGLDTMWPQQCSLGHVGIIDSAVVRHTRPIGGPNYLHGKEAGVTAEIENARILAKFNVDRIADESINLGGVTSAGDIVAVSDKYQEFDTFLRALTAGIDKLDIDMVRRCRYYARHWNFVTRTPRPYPRTLIGEQLRVLFGQPTSKAASPPAGRKTK